MASQLVGGRLDSAVCTDAAAAAAAELRPHGDLHASPRYRQRVARELAARVLATAAARADDTRR